MNSNHTVSRIRLDGSSAGRRPSATEEPTEGLVKELDNVMRLLKQPSVSPRSQVKDRSPSELDAALEMVKRAADVMGMMEERSRLMRTRAEALAEQARREAAVANERAASLERRAVASEARADELESKLREAEENATRANEWLVRFYDTITAHFATGRELGTLRAVA